MNRRIPESRDGAASQPRTEKAPVEPTAGLDPSAVEAWLFDLDNTLYPASCNLFAQIDLRMRRFIQDLLALEEAAARRLQKRYFREHGTTLRGLMERHAVDPEVFMDFVHAIDITVLAPDAALDAALATLPGRKLIYTNASTTHAERVLDRLGIAGHFEQVFDIAAADYQPKPRPESYTRLVERLNIEPSRAVFVEDSARNLAPAAALGMTTVWLASETRWAGDGRSEDFVHHVIDDLTDWLRGLTGPGGR